MTQQRIQLIVFDLGGVLVRIARSWQEVFTRAGLEDCFEAFDDSQAAEAKMQPAKDLYETGQISDAAMLEHVWARAKHCSQAQISAVLDAWLVEPYAGIEGLLEHVIGSGVKTACLSNTNERHWHTMMHTDARYAPLRCLDYRIASHLIAVAKPNPGAFEAAEHQTGIDAESIVFFDDDESNCQAARGRGWDVLQIDYTADTTAQITGHLRRLGVL
jgi:HAD superfamily hydrolase (TIGR01509 family)